MQEADKQPSARAASRSASQPALPGIWPAAGIAVLSGILCWFWLTSMAAGNSSAADSQTAASEVAPVDQQDLGGALATLGGSDAFLAEFRPRPGGCPRPLAWVSIMRTPGEKSGTLRLRSGGYISPLFTPSDVPMRVAIPYPAPYEAGHGALAVMDAGGGVTIALQPPWRIPAKSGVAAHDVVWHPSAECAHPNG